MLPVALNVETVPLGVAYGVRLGIRSFGGGVEFTGVAPLPPHPSKNSAAAVTNRRLVTRTRNARCLSIVKRPPVRIAARGYEGSCANQIWGATKRIDVFRFVWEEGRPLESGAG